MGFDVLYFPPIHPIGRTRRKGRNNTLDAKADDVGSPWAIGAAEGGHDGDPQRTRHARRTSSAWSQRAAELDIDIALDIAFQCAPDHPWVTEHPEWFKKRADGSIQYAENPPKKYQDIYPFDFETGALARAVAGAGRRVRALDRAGRAHLPRRQPAHQGLPVLGVGDRARARAHPDVIFLSEAFTRPRVMHRLAKVGFSQSYTYFTWRNTKHELTEYFTELSQGPGREYFRPNVWPNTPDILPAALQYGGRAVFMARVALAATLAANYGIYGPAYELLEARACAAAARSTSTPRSSSGASGTAPAPTRWPSSSPCSTAPGARIPALQSDAGLRFLEIDNEQMLAYAKATRGRLEHHRLRGQPRSAPHPERLARARHDRARPRAATRPTRCTTCSPTRTSSGTAPRNFVSLDPQRCPAHVMQLRARLRRENDFDYFL